MPHIIINEIQPAGSGTDEFIELFNPGDSDIVMDGYKLAKKTKTGSESALLSSAKFSGTIQAHGYFLIAHPSVKDTISADLAYSSSSYYVSNDNTVLLYDNAGAIIDKIGFGSATDFETAPASNPNNEESLERKNFADTENNSDDFSVNSLPSPKNSSQIETSEEEYPVDSSEEENDTPEITCITSTSDIKLSEIFPWPSSGEEFVEVKNVGDVCVDVSNWKILDGSGHHKGFPAGTVLEPGEYAYLEGNLYLNNDSDTVYLLDKNGNTKNDAIESRAYEKAEKDFSYSLDGELWSWTSTPTPGRENSITSSEEETSATSPETEEAYSLSDKICLNEIFPNPKEEFDEEYIELANNDSESIDLFRWILRAC